MALLKRKRAGLGDAMDVVTRFVNACNRHDADGVYSCLHPDFDSIQPMYPSRNFRGADQVRRNWQAIFDAEPGFRLTVLRSAVMDDTVWLELHGAGEDAEVAGVFVMGIQGDRIRWARIYSALVEPVPAGVGEPPAEPGTLQTVPAHEEPAQAAAGGGEVVEEALIAPVLDMERSGRRRRRRRGAGGAGEDAGAPADQPVESELEPQPQADADVVADGVDATDVVDVTDHVGSDADVTAVVSGDADMVTAVVVEGDSDVVVVEGDSEVAIIEGGSDVTVVEGDDEVAVVVEGDAEVAMVVEGDAEVASVLAAGPEVDVSVATDEETDLVVVPDEAPAPEPEPEALIVAPPDDDGGPATEAVDMVAITTEEPEAREEPQPAGRTPDPAPPRKLFGRKRT